MKNYSKIKRSGIYALILMLFSTVFYSCENDLTESDISPQNENLPKIGKSDFTSICYIEVNDNNILNVGSYTLKNSGKPFFDIATIFASNINYDAANKRPVLYFNPNVQHILTNKDKYIKPLQDKGIKVVLSVLGNHQGIGFANLTSANIVDFAAQCKKAVDDYGLDGIDFDDEWSEYGKVAGLPSPTSASYGRLLIELRRIMPNKLITLYDLGYSSGFGSQIDGIDIGTVIDHAYYPYYGGYSGNSIKGLNAKKWGPAPIGLHQGWNGPTPSDPTSNINRMIKDGYGVNLCYDMRAQNYSTYLSKISTLIYGEETVLSGKIYSKDW